ncbi:MAG: hypothetical protein ACEY3A_04480 [Wolbachia sp.]
MALKRKNSLLNNPDDSPSLFEFDASELDHDVGDHLSDNHNLITHLMI